MLAGQRVLLGHAQVVAWTVAAELRPFCERIEIAGSVRRRKATCKDAEIVCIPKPGRRDLFGVVLSDQVTDYLESQIGRGHWQKRPNIRGIMTFGPSNKLVTFDNFAVDIFSTTARNWGMTLLVRTGSAEFNKRAFTRFLQLGLEGHAYGGVTKGGVEIDCPDEETVFRLLGWEFAEPEARQ